MSRMHGATLVLTRIHKVVKCSRAGFPNETLPNMQEPPIAARTFVKFSIPLPDEIRDFYYNLEESKHTELNRDFKAAISACKVEFVRDEGMLSVITKDPTSQRRAGMLQEMHFRYIPIQALTEGSANILC